MPRPQLLRPLPPMWDGKPVRWSGLERVRGSIEYHFPPDECDICGSVDPHWSAKGEMMTAPDRAGRRRWYIRFWATRCRGCHVDVVRDARTDEVWQLGPEDYGPKGSHTIEGSLW